MRYYIGLIHKDPRSDFGVSFPDFPGCVSAGRDLDEAMSMGAEALRGHIALLTEMGEAIPEPSSMETIMASPENRDGVAVFVPSPSAEASRAVRVNITVPEDALREIDAYAEAHGWTRSSLLVRAAKELLAT